VGHGAAGVRALPELIEVLLSDSEVEQAWQLAVEHGCPQLLWMALAGAREDEHPLAPS
jgi:hypothetical protein